MLTYVLEDRKQEGGASSVEQVTTYHGDGERVDAFDVQDAVLPGDETLHVDVQLVPDGQDGLVVLLVPSCQNKDGISHLLTQKTV